MTTGIGLALLGIWITVATCWHSPRVPGLTAVLATIGALVFTTWGFLK